MCVDFSRLDARMPQELLDRVDVGPVHDEVAGEGVAEGVERGPFDAAIFCDFAEVPGEDVALMGAGVGG